MQKEKIRVYALARELDMESKDLVDFCRQAGFDVRNQLSSLEPEQGEQIRELVKKGSTKSAPANVKPVTPVVTERSMRNLAPAKPAPRREAAPIIEEPIEAPVAEPEIPAPAPAPLAAEAPPPPRQAPPPLPRPEHKLPPNLSRSAPPRPAATPPTAAPARPTPPPTPTPTATPTPPPSVTPAARTPEATPARPPEPRPTPIRPAASLPNLPGNRDMRDLTGRQPPRPPMRRPQPNISLAPRPATPPPLRALPAAKPKEEPRQKPIAKIDPKMFDQNRPIRPEDLLKPPGAAPAPGTVIADDGDEEGKDKKNLKRVPGEDRRRNARAERAEKRKVNTEEPKVKAGKLVTGDDEESSRRTLHHLKRKLHRPATMPRKGKVPIELPITIRSLSEALGVRSGELVKKLMMQGMMVTINSQIEPATAEVLGLEYGAEIEIKKPMDAAEQMLADLDKPDAPEDLVPRAPIVTIMGHVDHGKTSLLDKIRQSNVAATEAGGITQVIRAWRVDHGGRPVTFLDTPGHQAFTKMRARGAQVTDVAVIVVAADDGVMPQTEEAINHARAAGVSLVIAINKVDLPSANLNKTRQQLYGLNVLPDNMGGDTPFVETSAATGLGIDELLDQLSVVAELKELKANPKRSGKGVCLEAMLSEGEGVRATMLVQNGTLKRGDVILCGHAYGRVRQMYNDLGQQISEAGPSVPVRITGLDEVPNADDPFVVLTDLALARSIAEKRKGQLQEAALIRRTPQTLEMIAAQGKLVELKVIVKADFRGSVEAIRKELEKLDHAEVKLKILHVGIGAITESDVQLALTSPLDTLVVGFNVVPDDRALTMAEEKNVNIREYDIIYNLTNDVKAALEGKLKPREEIVHLGRAMIRETFKISRVGTIAGCYVTQGNIKRNAKVRVIREGIVIYPPADKTAGLESLKRFKEDVGEVREGFECGMKVAGYDDIKVGDVIEAFRVDQVQRTLDGSTK